MFSTLGITAIIFILLTVTIIYIVKTIIVPQKLHNISHKLPFHFKRSNQRTSQFEQDSA